MKSPLMTDAQLRLIEHERALERAMAEQAIRDHVKRNFEEDMQRRKLRRMLSPKAASAPATINGRRWTRIEP